MSSSASLSGRLRSFISRSHRMRWAISGVTGPRSSASAAADCAANDVGVGVIASARPSGVAPPKPPTGVAPPAAAPLSTMGVSSQRDRLPPDSAATGAVGVESQRLALAGASSRAGVSIQRDALAAATSRPGVLSQRAAPELGVSSKPVILSLVARSASTNKDAAQVRPGVEPQRAPSVAGVISTTIARAQGRESHRAVEALRICARSAPRIASRGRCSPEDDMAPSLPRRVADAGRRAAPGRCLRRRSASGSRRAQGEARRDLEGARGDQGEDGSEDADAARRSATSPAYRCQIYPACGGTRHARAVGGRARSADGLAAAAERLRGDRRRRAAARGRWIKYVASNLRARVTGRNSGHARRVGPEKSRWTRGCVPAGRRAAERAARRRRLWRGTRARGAVRRRAGRGLKRRSATTCRRPAWPRSARASPTLDGSWTSGRRTRRGAISEPATRRARAWPGMTKGVKDFIVDAGANIEAAAAGAGIRRLGEAARPVEGARQQLCGGSGDGGGAWPTSPWAATRQGRWRWHGRWKARGVEAARIRRRPKAARSRLKAPARKR